MSEVWRRTAERWDRDPYWCRCWPSALALGRLFTRQPELARGLRVCEVGAGLGIAGMAAAFAGMFSVCADYFSLGQKLHTMVQLGRLTVNSMSSASPCCIQRCEQSLKGYRV